MRARYGRPVYSDETIKEWADWLKREGDFAEKHTVETTKIYKVNDFFIECIQRKYDACMKKENEYGLRVWMQNPKTVDIKRISDMCLTNDWFNNADEANERFKELKAMCC